jgi:hypothetical protein
MPEFLHEVVKKREREMEYRTLMSPSYPPYTVAGTASYTLSGGPNYLRAGQFVEPHLTMPPLNEIAYRHESVLLSVTRHFVIFPNVGGWVQSTVSIDTLESGAPSEPHNLIGVAWRLLAGHPCRPNYTWANNTYTCNSCRAIYLTYGSEWTRA